MTYPVTPRAYAGNRRDKLMAQHSSTAARQFSFSYDVMRGTPDDYHGVAKHGTNFRQKHNRYCLVCGRAPAHLTVDRRLYGAQAPRLCFRCHYAVMQQRRTMQAQFKAHLLSEGGGELLVPRSSTLFGDSKYRHLTWSRRAAQKVARRALDSASYKALTIDTISETSSTISPYRP